MIPILYAGNEKNFISNGLGRLSDAISCKVEEERNGTFELEMTYPITGIHFADIEVNNIIYAKTEDGGNNQAFIIYKVSKPLNGIVTINAQHISYLLNGFVVMPFEGSSLADTMSRIAGNTIPSNDFTFSTDIVSSIAFKLESPRNVRNLLGGESGSILDVYGGGDYLFNNFAVSLLSDRGHDNGVTICYGKNLIDLKAVSNTTNIYTGIIPFWANGEGETVYVNGYVVYSDHADVYPYKYIKIVDFSNDFEEAPTQSQLLQKAQAYLNNNNGWQIKHNIEVSFVSLAQTDEYKDIAPLERVKLCDTVTVEYTRLGISFKTKVIKTVYNVLLDKYDSIELGDSTYTLAKAVQQANESTTQQETNSAIKAAVENATKLIRGGFGGHVVMTADSNGYPQEILIMDTDDITTARKVWRWNLNGLGYSSTGYDGTYGTAITMDGQIVANYITAGTFDGNLIRAGTIQANALSIDAMNAIVAKHSYISDAIFTDISTWNVPSGVPAVYYETIDDKTYLVLDGTGISAYDASYRVSTLLNMMGDVKYNVHFVYHIDREVTVAQQRFPFIAYTNTNEEHYTTWTWLPAQTIPADTDFTWDVTLTTTNIDPRESAEFGFYFIPQCKIYLEELTVTSTVDDYAGSGMKFNQNGLELLSSRVEEVNTHNYTPYDLITNLDRWEKDGEGTVTYAFENITVDGVTKPALKIDGTALNQNETVHLRFGTDLIGSNKIYYKFKYQIDRQKTFATATNLMGYEVILKNTSSYYSNWLRRINANVTKEAYTEYPADAYYTTGNVDYYAGTPYFWFNALAGVVTYYYDIEITVEDTVYKKSSLTYTADGLNSVVQAGSIISTINQSAETVKINASQIDLTGNLNLHGTFTTDTSSDPDLQGYYSKYEASALEFYDNNDDKLMEVAPRYINGQPEFGIFFFDSLGNYNGITGNKGIFYDLITSGNTDIGNGQGHNKTMQVHCDAKFWWEVQFYDNVYNSGGSIVFISDRNKKRSIKDLALKKAKSFLMALTPRIFKFKDGTSGRFHHGFIAQEVKEAMGADDWGVYCENKENDFIGLRYDEFLADIVAVIQDQEKRIEALERALHDYTNDKS